MQFSDCIAITATNCRAIALMGSEQGVELLSAGHTTKTVPKATSAPRSGIRQTAAAWKQSNLCCPGRGREGFSQKKNRDNSTYFAPEAWQRLLA